MRNIYSIFLSVSFPLDLTVQLTAGREGSSVLLDTISSCCNYPNPITRMQGTFFEI